MRISPRSILGLAALLASTSLQAQATKAPEKNFVSNGSFESSFKRENIWDGVDSAGYFSGERGSVPILTQSGALRDSSMPISVGVADMNSDGLQDIVTMDVLSYVRIFFNSGTPQEPKFTIGELAGIFVSRTPRGDPLMAGADGDAWQDVRTATRMFPSEIMRNGKKNLIVGNYAGEILLIPNEGSAQTPDFKQPADIGRIAIPTMKDSNDKWGNVFAPATFDWNGDGKEDLLIGEGSYSANNIHLLINQGSPARPVFDENNRHVIAFGDGLEQLTPTVVDYNGDGNADILVAERSGKIAVYLNNGEKPKLGEKPSELPFTSFISGASGSSPLSFGGICTVSTGDLNGDGLFDLVVGKTNGRVAMALNTGTKTEPKFASPTDLKGDTGTAPFAVPSGWSVDYGLKRGNFYGYVTVVKAEDDKDAQPADGKAVLKAGYMPSPNKIMAPPRTFTQGFGKWSADSVGFQTSQTSLDASAPARFFLLRQDGRSRLNFGKKYTLSFKVKGRFNDGKAVIGWVGYKKLSEARVKSTGDRGAASIQRNEAREEASESVKFSSGAGWVEVKKDFRATLKNKDLQDLKTVTADLNIAFSIPEGGVAYFDDVKIIEQP